jgi:putative membrane protein insertion efficiency factor
MLNLLSKFLFISILTLIPFYSNAQDINVLSDLQLISKSINEKQTYIRPYIYKDSKSAFIKYNPVSLTFGGLLFIYQNTISYQFSADCLYNPSCSEFSKNSIREYGLFKGCLLSADRLMRCNRISAAGIPACKFDKHTHKVCDSVNYYSITK